MFLINFGFITSIADASLFIYNCAGIVIYFLVYVDDILITGNYHSAVSNFIRLLNNRFSLKDLGLLQHFLGVEVIHNPSGLFLRHIFDV